MEIVRWIAIVVGGYVVLALSLDGLIAYFQPEAGRTGVLRTFDEDGTARERVLSVFEDDGTLWVESGHYFRGWYYRVRANPEVELTQGGETKPYRAVALDTPEAQQHVIELMKQVGAIRYWLSRAMLLFAPIKPVRLDPR